MAQKITNLPIGSKIKFGLYSVEESTAEPIVWQVIGHNHYKDGNNINIVDHVTLITEKLIDTKGFDAKEPDNSRGNNQYNVSNIRQWLNSTGAANSWYSPQHEYDMPPTYEGFDEPTRPKTNYDNENGFLHSSNFSNDELNFIVPTKIWYSVGTGYYDDEGNYIDEGYSTDKMFLLSAREVAAEEYSTGFSLFNSDESRKAYFTQQAFDNGAYISASDVTSSHGWWLRDAHYSSYSQIKSTYYVASRGILSWDSPYTPYYGIRPATNISANALVSDTTDADGCYTILPNTKPTITSNKTDLGDKYEPFAIPYQVSDTDEGDILTVTIDIDGVLIDTIANVEKDVETEYTINADAFDGLPYGYHTITIKATDAIGAFATKIYTFNKCMRLVITESGRRVLAALFVGEIPWPSAIYVAVGKGSTAAVDTDSKLEEEGFRKRPTQITRQGDMVVIRAFFGVNEANGDWQEYGVFIAGTDIAGSGHMLGRAVVPISKTDRNTLTLEIRIPFKA